MQQENREHRNQQATAILIFGILILLRLLLSSRLPSYIMSNMPHDDGWVVTHALFIMKGEWLGPYDQFTLIKGPFSPLLLAFSAFIGVTFGGMNTALYCLSCVVFVASIRPIIKNNWMQILCFAVLLFNPISYALETGQRIYRNGIGQWEILLIFGCLIAVFLRRNENWKGLLKWALVCGLALGAFLQTREDGVWIYPFVMGALIATIIAFLLDKEGPKIKIFLFLLPVVIPLLLSCATAIANYTHYGAPIVNDRSGGNFAKVAGDLFLITPNANEVRLYESEAYKDNYYNIYVSTMEKAFAASPALNGASQPIRDAIQVWGGWENLKNGQLSTDHMLFALRDGVKSAGYYHSLPETEEFYGRVHKEIQMAFESGTLVKRGFPISPLIPPLQKRDFGKTISLLPMAIRDTIKFNSVSSAAVPANGSEIGIKEFSLMAGGDYFTSTGLLIGSGWAFSEDNNTRLTAGLYDKDEALIAILPFHGGEDVFEGFKSKYQNARTSRFTFKINGYDLKSGLTLRFFDKNGNIISQIPADGSATCGGLNGSFHYCIDGLKNELSPGKFYARFINRANYMIGVYQKLTPLVSLLACLTYFAATILLIQQVLKKEVLKMLPVWIILTGLGSTFMLLMFIMCLITATSFNALIYLYTAPAYVLLLMFCSVSVCWAAQVIFGFKVWRQRSADKHEIKNAPLHNSNMDNL